MLRTMKIPANNDIALPMTIFNGKSIILICKNSQIKLFEKRIESNELLLSKLILFQSR